MPSRAAGRGRTCYVTLEFLGLPNAKRGDKVRTGYLTAIFSVAQKRTEVLCNPSILGDPQCQAAGENGKYLTAAFPGP